MRLTEFRDGGVGQAAIHRQALDERSGPEGRQILDTGDAARVFPQQGEIALRGSDARRLHLAGHARLLICREGLAQRDIGEGQRAARFEHPRAFADHRRLFRHMQPGLLADDHVECGAPQRHRGGVAVHEIDQRIEPDPFGQAACGLDTREREVEAGDMAANLVGDPACRAAHAAADIEHPMLAANAGTLHQSVDHLDAAIVVLVEILELVFAQCCQIVAACAELGHDLVLVDRVGVVEADHRRLLGIHCAHLQACLLVETVVPDQPLKPRACEMRAAVLRTRGVQCGNFWRSAGAEIESAATTAPESSLTAAAMQRTPISASS